MDKIRCTGCNKEYDTQIWYRCKDRDGLYCSSCVYSYKSDTLSRLFHQVVLSEEEIKSIVKNQNKRK